MKIKKLFFIVLILLSNHSFSQFGHDDVVWRQVWENCSTYYYDQMIPVISDNFNGNQLDMTTWKITEGCPRDQDDALHWFSPENVSVDNGELIIRTEDEYTYGYFWHAGLNQHIWKDFYYTSGEIGSHQYLLNGTFEIRCKIPPIEGEGNFPAFWIWGQCHEIDIFEFWDEAGSNDNGDLRTNLHCEPTCMDEDRVHHPGTHNNGTDYTNDYHIYRVEWNPITIKYFVDGTHLRTIYHYADQWGISCIEECEDLIYGGIYMVNLRYPTWKMHVIIDNAIMHNYGNFPSYYKIDYVRVEQGMKCNDNYNLCDYEQDEATNTVIAGNDINFGVGSSCNAILHGSPQPWIEGESLSLFAVHEINIASEFIAEYGSHLTCQIVDCSSKAFALNSSSNRDDHGSNSNNDIENPKIKLFPNPNNGIFIVEFLNKNTTASLTIYDQFGRQKYQKENIQENYCFIDISEEHSGVYYLWVIVDGGILTERIIIK